MREFIDFVQTLKPPRLHPQQVSLIGWTQALKDTIDAGERLDRAKKALAYGKKLDHNQWPESQVAPKYMDHRLDPITKALPEDVLHGLLGIITESSEIAEILVEADKQPFDVVNLKEELGDLLWYMALICKELDITFEELMRINMAKLKKRFPDKFTGDAAINRDVEAEREVLERVTVNPALGAPYTKEGIEAGQRLMDEEGGLYGAAAKAGSDD